MARYTRDDLAQVAQLARAFPSLSSSVSLYVELETLAHRHRRICERQCNGYHDGKAEQRNERMRNRIEEQAQKLLALAVQGTDAASLLVLSFQHDPRGATFRLSLNGSDGSNGSWLSGNFLLF